MTEGGGAGRTLSLYATCGRLVGSLLADGVDDSSLTAPPLGLLVPSVDGVAAVVSGLAVVVAGVEAAAAGVAGAAVVEPGAGGVYRSTVGCSSQRTVDAGYRRRACA